MNNITVAGQLGRDAEVRFLQDGSAVANFSVADSQGREKPTIWWNCSLFGKRAESLAPYLMKGQAVTVSGNITEREYQKDGVTHKAMDLRVNDVALQGGKREEGAAPRQAPAQGQAPRQTPAARPASGFSDMDDDIQFRDPLAYRGAHWVL